MFSELLPKNKINFLDAVKAVEAGCCPFCHEPIVLADFRDEASRAEYERSRICQKCIDEEGV